MKFYKLLFFAASLSTPIQAATVSFDMGADTLAALPAIDGGARLGTGFTVHIGRYTGGNLATTATAAEITPLFIVLASAPFVSGMNAGYVGVSDTDYTDAQGYGNQPFAVWFTDGGNNNAIVTGFGVGGNPGNFPVDAAIPNNVPFFINVDNAPLLIYRLGSYSASGVTAGGGGEIVLNNAIPEPSAALLGAIGVLGLLRRRRN